MRIFLIRAGLRKTRGNPDRYMETANQQQPDPDPGKKMPHTSPEKVICVIEVKNPAERANTYGADPGT